MVSHPWFCNEILCEYEDEMNKTNVRNVDNTDKCSYNCGGYALNTFSWYQPIEDEYFNNPLGNYFDTDEERDKAFRYCVDNLLRDFAYRNIRLIGDIDDIASNEYAFAFRVSSDGDFHFVKRSRNGIWRHKRGRNPLLEIMHADEVFSKCWCNRYDSPIAFFCD